jgi:hypothetical protein
MWARILCTCIVFNESVFKGTLFYLTNIVSHLLSGGLPFKTLNCNSQITTQRFIKPSLKAAIKNVLPTAVHYN